MRVLTKVLALVIFAHLGLILFTNRALYFSKFDEVYWKDKYEHSQWKLPLSVRTLGDDGLYLYEGYRIIKGGDPTLLNAEVPPLGKYLIGLSILVFGNGHWYGFLINTLALVVLFLLSKTLLGSSLGALLVTTLVAVDPLVTSQFPLTMLDSLQLLFLLFTFYLLLRIRSHAHVFIVILAGIAFGLFSETKFPILGPPIAILAGLYLWRSTKSFKHLLLFFAASAAAYLLPYTHYFSLGHNFLDWLRVQKWIASFYAHANLTPNIGSSMTALLVGWYQNLFTKVWVRVPEWSPAWTGVTLIAAVSSVGVLWKIFKGKEKPGWLPVAGFTIFSLLFFAIIPFWTRYLVLLLPFFYLSAARVIVALPPRLRILLFAALLIANAMGSSRMLFPTPEGMVKQFAYNWQYGFFSDIYEDLTDGNKGIDRAAFRRFGLKTFAGAEIESVAVDILTNDWSPFRSPQNVRLRLTYFTRNLGPFTEERTITLIKERGRWKIPWQWDYLMRGLREDTHPETTVLPAKRGNILASDKTKLGEDFPSYLIWLTPKLVDKSKENAMLKLLKNLFDHNVAAIAFHERLVGNTEPDIPIPMGVLYKAISEPTKQELLSYPGISLTSALGRLHRVSNIVTVGEVENSNYFECCSWLYTTTTYDGISGIEKERNKELKGYNGGTLVIKDNQGNILRTILDLPKRDGKDVQL